MFNNSSPFPHESFEQFKQLKFVFDDSSSPKQQSPVKPHEQSLSRPQQKSNPPSKQKGKATPQPAIPSHSFGSSKGMTPQRSADPFSDSLGPSSATNAYAQSLSSSTGGVRLQDLCPEDKQKIGELIKKLAEEKEEKEKLRKQLETKDDHYKGLIDNLTKENEDIVKNASDLQNEFKSSLSLLKSFQESTDKQRAKSKENRMRRQQQQEEDEEDDLQFSQSQPQGQFSHSISQRKDRKTKSISNNLDDLTVSYLDKGETLRENRERISPLKESNQRQRQPERQPEFRMQEQPVHKEKPMPESKPPKKKGNVIETLKKEQKAIDEISRLKEDIEGLASSFKKINFSPVESFGAKENEAPRGHQPVFENKNASPIKLVQNYDTGSSEKKQRYDRGYQDYSPPRQPKSPAQQVYYQESFGKQPSGLKAASGYSSNQKAAKQEEKGNSSSDEDEVAIAQKWLNLRKQKIQQINKELNKEKESPKQQRHIQDSPQRHEMHYIGSDEKRRRGEEESLYQSRRDEHMQQKRRDHYDEYDQDEERYRMEQEIQRLQMELKNERRQRQEEQMNRTRPPLQVETQSYRKQQYPQQRFEEIEDRDQYSQTWRKNSPPVREARSGGFSSATMSGGKALKDKAWSRQSFGSGSKFQQEALSPTGVVNLNQMSIEDLMNLKNVLDDRIKAEKPEAARHHREEYIPSPSRAFIQPQEQQRHDNVFGQRAYMPKGNLSPKLNTMETDSHFLERLRTSGQKTFQTEDHDYERRLAESTIHGRTDPGVDMSLMRDFNSIGNTPANRMITEGITFPTETPMTQKTETARDLDYESLYEEKLKEFLKVRERMVKSNKIKDNGLDIEEILKSTLLESKRTNNTVEPHNLMSMQKYTYTNSPATARSFGKPEPPKLSSRDLMLSPPIQALDQQRHPFQTKYIQEQPEFRVPTFESEPKKQEYQFMTQPKQMKSPPGKKQMEPIEELGQLADDFYDDGLFDLVDDIEKKGATPAAHSSNSILPDSKTTSSRNKNSITNIDDEFKNLFTTVKTMFSPNDDTTTDRIREQLFGRSPKFDKSGLTGYDKSGLTGFNTSKLSYDDEDVENESILNLPAQVLNIGGEKGISRKTSGQRSTGSLTQLRTSKNDVSAVESDASMLAINRKINEMKKKKKPMKF